LNVFQNRSAQIAAIIKSLFHGIILLIVYSFTFKITNLVDSRALIVSIAVVSAINLVLIRVGLARLFFVKYSTHLSLARKVAIIGAGESGKLLAAKLAFEEILGIQLVGFIDDRYPTGTNIISGFYTLGDIEDLPIIKEKYDIEELIISIDTISYPDLLDLIDRCNELNYYVKLNSLMFDIIPRKLDTESYLDIPVVELTPIVNTKMNLLSKKIVDIIGACIGIIIFSPVFVIIASLIRLSSKGPILYKQIRIGKNGKPFMFYKFRSMKTAPIDDDVKRKDSMIEFMKKNKTIDSGSTKIINEERVTWIGKFLRKTSLDELPQLLNVLRGEMSLVGPRPCIPYEYENYDLWQKRRLSVTPGCTGLWQVSGRSNVSFNDSVVLDLYYINNMTPWLDLQLIIKTIPVMILGRGGK
jgi:undecaprenyl-phosphate galactose phosphotransferase